MILKIKIPEPEDFVDVYVPFVMKLLESKPNNPLDIYRFSTNYFEDKLKKRKGTQEKEIFKVYERTRKCYKGSPPEKIYNYSGQWNIPNECDFIYESAIELHPIDTIKLNDCHIPLSPKTAETFQNTSQSEWTKHTHLLNVALHTLHLNFAKILNTIHHEMDAGNTANIFPDDSQYETVVEENGNLKKEQALTMQNFEIMDLSPSKTKTIDNTCHCFSSGLNQIKKIKMPCSKCRTLNNVQFVKKHDPQYILDDLKLAKEVIDSVKDTLICQGIKSQTYSENYSKSLQTTPIPSICCLNLKSTMQQLIERKGNTVGKISTASKNFNVNISKSEGKDNFKHKSISSKCEFHKECLKHFGEFKNVLDVGPKGYNTENICRALKQKHITCDEGKSGIVNNKESMPKKQTKFIHKSKENDGLPLDSQHSELKMLIKRKNASDIANGKYIRENTEIKSLSGSPTSEKTLTLEKAFGIRSLSTEKGNTIDIKREKSAFVKAQNDSFCQKTDNWARYRTIVTKLRQTNAEKKKLLMKEATENSYTIKDNFMNADDLLSLRELVWKRVFEHYF